MYVPRGYERYFNRYHQFTPSPVVDNATLAFPPWGGTIYAAGQAAPPATTTVQAAAASAAIPMVLLGFAGLALGGYFTYRYVRKHWGKS